MDHYKSFTKNNTCLNNQINNSSLRLGVQSFYSRKRRFSRKGAEAQRFFYWTPRKAYEY